MHHLAGSVAKIPIVLVFLLLCYSYMLPPPAEAHFFGGKTLNVDKYQVTFVPYPTSPIVGSNSTTLNFSVLQNNTDIYNVYSALTIMKKSTREIIAQYPYKLYIVSDITIPFAFNETGDYTVTLQTRLIGDAKYQAEPLTASFNLTVISPLQAMLSDRTVLAAIIIPSIVGVGSIVCVYVWKRM